MLKVESNGPVCTITLNRPDVRNAINDELIEALSEAFIHLHLDMRVVVLAAEGKSFCAGGDLQWMQKASEYTEEENYEDALKLSKLFKHMMDSHAVIVARVNGHAFGGGCGLVAASDVAVGSKDAKFSFSEVKLGLIPATISPFVIEKIGRGHARALFTTGEVFDAQKACNIGLIHECVPAEDLDKMVDAKIDSILQAGPRAVAEVKRLVRYELLSPENAARHLAKIRATEEGKEGVAAFLEKRKASFVVER